jgi:nucleotide-binding universal stress UspA family protein
MKSMAGASSLNSLPILPLEDLGQFAAHPGARVVDPYRHGPQRARLLPRKSGTGIAGICRGHGACTPFDMAYKRILVPVDGSATSKLGLREAIGLAKSQGASLQLVHVVDQHYALVSGAEMAIYSTDLLAGLKQGGRRLLDNAEALVKRQGLKCSSVLLESAAGPAANPIVRQARKWSADLIVMGTHGRRGIRRLVMGSDAEQILRSSPVPVLLVRFTK